MAVLNLKCNQCGNMNPEGARDCSLCGDTLADEKHEIAERKRKMNTALLVPLTLLVTALFVYAPGWVCARLLFSESDPSIVWGVYLAAWALALALGHYFRPKDEYDLGWNMGPMGFWDKPYTLRDDYHRWHAFVGFLLFPVNIVRACWVECWRALTGADRTNGGRRSRG